LLSNAANLTAYSGSLVSSIPTLFLADRLIRVFLASEC
jgi:hypothetical protein